MFKKILDSILGSQGGKEARAARKNQITYLIGLILIVICIVVIFSDTEKSKPVKKNDDVVFDGVFGENFSKLSDEALIDKQASKIEALEHRSIQLEKEQHKKHKDDSARKSIALLEHKINALEKENKLNKEALRVALIQSSRKKESEHPYIPIEQDELDKRHLEKAELATIRFNAEKNHRKKRNPNNYVWGGTFAEGVMLTGAKADAGINGSKNTGIIAIRLTTDGMMPNRKRSHLKDCVVLASSYGDLSDDSVVMHLETMSCASSKVNFEKQVYGGVFDSDAMQDVRGTSILKTKPLLEYSAAAGLLAGIGDGLRSYGSAQSVNSNGSITTFSPSNLGQSAFGSALSNPANRISDYIMKIADIYHPVVKARPGRVVTVLFTKGFFIDSEHQKYEAFTKSHSNNQKYGESTSSGNLNHAASQLKKDSALDFLNKNNKPLFSDISKKGVSSV